MNTDSPKIAILHDAFLYRGGGERLVTLMAKSLGADIVTGFFSEGSFDPRELGFEGKMIPLGKPVFAKGWRHLLLKWRFLFQAKVLREYDIVIFSGNCLEAVKHVRSDARKVYYCHTPPRYLFDLRESYLQKFPRFLYPAITRILDAFARSYTDNLKKFDTILTNSKNVYERLERYCHMRSAILYPPIDIHRFSPGEKTKHGYLDFPEYFLSFSRLSPPKRVDIIVEAFLQMPEKNLILTYGKNDPEKENILARIVGVKNIIALESPNDTELIELIRGATATIYIPVDEDFGMSPVESMACGIPVIGVDEGGLKETIADGRTGKLISIPDRETGIQSIKNLIEWTERTHFDSMRRDSILRALDFSLEKFEKSLSSHLGIDKK